ncbi:MAG: alpha/beta hydrolase [Legionella sp.]|nr:alpha/beta hydrolase [Legionella sp.]
MEKILFIGGSLTTKNVWALQETVLESHWHCDHLDINNSSSLTEMAERYVPSAPERFPIVAFSMGGYIALELFRLIPNRIEKLILINSSARELCEVGKADRKRSLSLIKKGKFNFLINRIFKNSIHKYDQQESVISLLKEMAYEVGDETYANQLLAMINKPDQSLILPKIQCPVLILASREDKVMPNERSEHLASMIKGSKLVYIEECGHMAMLEQSTILSKIIADWL